MKLQIKESREPNPGVELVWSKFYPGEWGCSRCGADLSKERNKCLAISEIGDDEGYAWRAFCSKCDRIIGLNEHTPNEKLQQIYDMFPPTPAL